MQLPNERLQLKDCITGKVHEIKFVDPLAPISPDNKVNLEPEVRYGLKGNKIVYWRDPINNHVYKPV